MAAIPPVLGSPNGSNAPQPQQAPPQPSGQVAPQEAPNTPVGPYGPNNMYLAEKAPEIVEALRTMVTDYRAEGLVARRHEIRRIRQARMFFQGLQYAYFDNDKDMWVVPFSSTAFDDKDEEEQPRWMFVTNFYLGYCLAFIAVISSDVPNVRVRAQKASKIEDVRAAEKATDVIGVIEENNKPVEMLEKIGMYLFTDGKIGGYVRYVSDAERFGTNEQPIIESQYVPMGPDVYNCPNCQAQSSEDQVAASGMLACPQCGNMLGENDLQKSPRMQAPVQTGTREVPNGQEVISIVDGLQLNTPVWATEQWQFPYLQWQMESHRALLKATYPHIEDKIQMGGAQGADEVYARTSRLSVLQGLPAVVPGDTLYDLVTYSQTWIRPSSFFRLDNKELRKKIQALFPHGCYVAFAGDTYCISRDEKMDDHWRVLHAYPGDGQNRPSVGDPVIELQERYNTLSNIAMEMYEMGLGSHFADPEVINFDSLKNTTTEPGAWYPAKPRTPGANLQASFYEQQSQDVPNTLPEYAEQLSGETAQFVTGLFPAIFGGEAKGAGGETASGYSLSRDQAMGRIGLVWRRLKEFYAAMMLLGVKCFAENRPADVEISVEGVDGKDEPDYIRLDDLQGNIKVTPEGDENFPRMTSQKKAALDQLFTTFGKDPAFLEMIDLPANLEFVRDVNGLTELQLPGVDAARQQKVETKTLLQSPPQQIPSPTGPQPQSTVKVDPLLDDHDAHIKEIQRLVESEEGEKIKRTNPGGFENLRQHAIEHIKGKAAKQAMMAAMAGPLPGAAPPPVAAPPPAKGAPPPGP